MKRFGMLLGVMALATLSFGSASHAQFGVGGPHPNIEQAAASDQARRAEPRKKARKPAKRTTEPKKQSPPARVKFTEAEQEAAIVPGMPDARFWGDSTEAFMKVLPTTKGPWLLLSSGGAAGAYGAGVLAGWSAAGDRPEFSVVTGVSTGAMTAPYAFLGSKYDEQLRNNFTGITSADIFEVGGKGESFLDTWPLKDLIAKRVTPQMLEAIAAEHKRGRRLFVVTGNMDAERPVVWNMGAIAVHGGEAGLKLFREVLLAASSIPGAFPPVYFDVEAGGKRFQEMHADGGMFGPFYAAPNAVLGGADAARLPASDLYIVVNSKLTPEFEMPEREITSVLGRAIAIALKAGARLELMVVSEVSRRNNIGFKVAYVNDDFNVASRGNFDPDYMKALFQLGFDQAKAGTAFRTEAPSGAARSTITKN